MQEGGEVRGHEAHGEFVALFVGVDERGGKADVYLELLRADVCGGVWFDGVQLKSDRWHFDLVHITRISGDGFNRAAELDVDLLGDFRVEDGEVYLDICHFS
ncbi:hypothetical protein EBU02_12450 [bacterium]|nr:hypothetical protein [bacterium]NBS53184.1 hypothetical protein [Spartobacteria bacterium]